MQQENWIKLRKKLLTQVKSQVLLQTGQMTDDLVEYSKSYDKEFRGSWKISSRSVLMDRIRDMRLVLGGEFHPFAQSQRTHLRILRSLVGDRPVIVALECIEAKHQNHLDDYSAGKISEEEFLAAVKWNEHWNFPWPNYKPIFNLAISRGYRLVGVNRFLSRRNAENLKKRDKFSAKKIIQLVKSNPNALVYTIYGEWHLAENHLPSELYSAMPGLKNQTLKIVQNSEKLYFKLALENKESHVNVLEYGKNRFCIMSSPPWVQWQSYLMYLETTSNDQNLCEDDESDEYDNFEMDYTDSLSSQLKFIVQGLGQKLKLNDLEVYSSSNPELWRILKDKLSSRLFKHAEYCIKNEFSFYFPEKNFLFLSRPSVNHMSTIAGCYLQSKLSQRKKTPTQMPNDFLRCIWLEALSFFISKLVNHQRKSDSLEKLKSQLATSHPTDHGREVLLLALDQRLTEVLMLHGQDKIKRKFNPRNKNIYYESSKILGSMLGDKIYISYRTKRISNQDIVDYLKVDIFKKDFDKKYFSVLSQVENVNFISTFEGVMYGS